MWIFGYGSLIWKPGFDYIERRDGFIEDWKRRFWQGSVDHRGVPGSPGRVATLLPEAGERVWGAAYRVSHQEYGEIVAQLDHREKGGYERHRIDVITPEAEPEIIEEVLMYVATDTNRDWQGPASTAEIIEQILASEGPSGTNLEYLLRLAGALREMEVEDAHVFELEAVAMRLLRGV